MLVQGLRIGPSWGLALFAMVGNPTRECIDAVVGGRSSAQVWARSCMSGSIRAWTIGSVVVLRAPFGPRKPVIIPASNADDGAVTAGTSPKRLVNDRRPVRLGSIRSVMSPSGHLLVDYQVIRYRSGP